MARRTALFRSLIPVPLVALMLAVGPVAAQTAPEPIEVDPGPRFVPESFAELSDRLSPAVVNVTTTTTVADIDDGMRPVLPPGSPFEDFFRDFMDRQEGMPRQQQRSNALGSGFIISADGYIVTNNHVIESADEITVELFGGGELDAEVIGRDTRTDIALLKVESETPLPFVAFGDSDAAKVGDWVLAIGNPLGQGFSVSAGIVSARNRMLQGSYDDFIQTDAAINRGNSGGPLFDMNGKVIGVNTAILSPNGGSIGIGFAMSSAVVTRVVDQLRDFGETRRGWLGVRIQNVDQDVADALGLAAAKGALVTDVPEGPALAAGMKAGDVILRFGDEEIDDTRELVRIVADTEIGRSVPVLVFREGAETTLDIEIGLLEEATLAAAPGSPPGEAPAQREETVLGMTVAAVTDTHREEFGLDKDVRGLDRDRPRRHLGRLFQGRARGRRDRRGRPGGGGDPAGHARPHRGRRGGGAQLDPAPRPPRRRPALRRAEPEQLSRRGPVAAALAAAWLAASFAGAARAGEAWIGTWSASPQPVAAGVFEAGPGVPRLLEDQTIRQVARVSLGGDARARRDLERVRRPPADDRRRGGRPRRARRRDRARQQPPAQLRRTRGAHRSRPGRRHGATRSRSPSRTSAGSRSASTSQGRPRSPPSTATAAAPPGSRGPATSAPPSASHRPPPPRRGSF